MQYKTQGEMIASVLRKRICMMQSDTRDIILHEGLIATEFGVSRTPIRQVLQKLAHERLVETRTGVGTVVPPLRPESKAREIEVLRLLFQVAAETSGDGMTPPEFFDRLIAVSAVSAHTQPDAQGYLDTRVSLLEITTDVAPDKILADAIRAAHWRHIRWRMSEHAWANGTYFSDLISMLKACTSKGRGLTLSSFFSCLAEAPL